MTTHQLVTAVMIYVVAFGSLAVVAVSYASGRLPRWVGMVYLLSLAVCVFGWELWISAGLVDGLPVDMRRPEVMSRAVPAWINWLTNSLGDAGVVCMPGLAMVWLAYGRSNKAFERWHWGAFALLFTWFMAQNVFIETVVYHEQVSAGFKLSWGPMMPGGPWFNPTLFELGGRPVQLQTQSPWLLMTPLFYWITIACYRRWGGSNSGGAQPS